MPTVPIAHSEEKHRSFDRVYSLVNDALERIGGIESFVKPGQTVLIRPDQSVPRLAEDGLTADPLVVAVLIRMAYAAGAAKVQVGASSSGFLSTLACMEATGMAALARTEGAELIDLGSDDTVNRDIDLPEARVLHRVPLPAPLLDAEVILAVVKAKTDYLDLVSGSMAYCAGSVNQKWRASQEGAADEVERFADAMMAMRPDLTVVDALICGEGDGPHGNLPHWCGCILASADPVATDVAIAMLMGRNWDRLQFAAAAEQRGLGNRVPIVFLGKPLEHVAFQAWPSHRSFAHLPVNVLVGKGVTESGSIGHVKSALETLGRDGLLQKILRTGRTPTIMIGDVDDPQFERHLEQGPYVIFDDAAQDRYKDDPRACFVPGHPVLHSALPALTEILAQSAGLERKHRILESKAGTGAAAAASGALAGLAIGAALWMRGTGKRG